MFQHGSYEVLILLSDHAGIESCSHALPFQTAVANIDTSRGDIKIDQSVGMAQVFNAESIIGLRQNR